MRLLDLVVLAVALPLFALAGLPLLGWAAPAAASLVQRGLQALLGLGAAASGDPRRMTLVLVVSMLTRVWLVAIAIFAAGTHEREAGLSAALLSIVLVTAHLTTLMIDRPARPAGPAGVAR